MIQDGELNEQFYLSVFVFLQHRSSLNDFLTRFLLYISNRAEQYNAERHLSFHWGHCDIKLQGRDFVDWFGAWFIRASFFFIQGHCNENCQKPSCENEASTFYVLLTWEKFWNFHVLPTWLCNEELTLTVTPLPNQMMFRFKFLVYISSIINQVKLNII